MPVTGIPAVQWLSHAPPEPLEVPGPALEPTRGGHQTPYLMAIPSLVVLLPFFAVPILVLGRNSLNRDTATGLMASDLSAQNYVRLVTDPFYLKILANTFVIAMSVTAVALAIGFPFAYYLVRYAGRVTPFLRWALYTPLVVSVIVMVYGWMILTSDTGLINSALMAVGIVERPLRILFDPSGVFIGLLHRYLPLMVFPVANSLLKIAPGLLAASASLGGCKARTFWRVTVPLTLPGVVAGVQLVFAAVLSDFVIPMLLGDARFRLMAPAIYDEAMSNLRWALAGAMSMAMLGVIGLLLLISSILVRRAAPWARSL